MNISVHCLRGQRILKFKGVSVFFVLFGKCIRLDDIEIIALDYFLHFLTNGLKVCHMRRDSATGKITLIYGAYSLVLVFGVPVYLR